MRRPNGLPNHTPCWNEVIEFNPVSNVFRQPKTPHGNGNAVTFWNAYDYCRLSFIKSPRVSPRVRQSDGNMEMWYYAPSGACWKCVFSSFAVIVRGLKSLSSDELVEQK